MKAHFWFFGASNWINIRLKLKKVSHYIFSAGFVTSRPNVMKIRSATFGLIRLNKSYFCLNTSRKIPFSKNYDLIYRFQKNGLLVFWPMAPFLLIKLILDSRNKFDCKMSKWFSFACWVKISDYFWSSSNSFKVWPILEVSYFFAILVMSAIFRSRYFILNLFSI